MTTDPRNLITPDSIIFSLEATSREEAFIEMIDHLIAIKKLPNESREEILSALENRESQIPTSIGKGLAIPHAAIHDLPSSVCMLARSEKGIGRASSDNQPIRFFYLSLIPDNDYSNHLRTIASISSFFRDHSNLSKLDLATSKAELERVFSA